MAPTTPEAKRAWIRETLSQWEGPLLRYATKIVSDVDVARDVVQDTFVKLCQQPREDVEDHLAQWLFTVCRNRALDVRRKETRMNTQSISAAREVPAKGPAPSEVAEARQDRSRILGAMDTLPENQRECLRLKFQNGMSYKEIAAITGLSVSNVGYLIHVGIKALRADLAGGTT